MSLGSKLVAHYSERNKSNGRLQFALQTDGNLVLQTLAYPIDWSNTAYWLSGTIGSGFQVVFNESGSIYLTTRNGSILTVISSNPSSTQDFYQRAIMEYDEVFTQYVYPKNSTNSSNAGSWPMAWSSLVYIPPNICYLLEDIGSGACGFNSYCVLEDDRKPNCRCPPGYTFINLDDITEGCKQNFRPQSCDEASPETFVSMQNTNWPQSGFDYAKYGGGSITEDWRRKACLDDCFCAVAIFGNGQRFKKKIRLSNGRLDPTNAANKDNSTFKPSGADLLKKNHSTVILIMEKVGRGAFAKVYKGILEYEDRKLVAVKRMNDFVKDCDMEFKAEVSAIGSTNHRNLVQLLGYCNEGQHRLLVYDFMSNGSLASFLFGGSQPYWYQRIQIALEAARKLT
ncbi:hypothetical protein CMV_018467 [Castanea mollissima]|uniref:Protein kinase domain-containing protein n=1 Tax=Castanea mollissima TaxID=60419 RepID=A0A8J4R3C3_9ROSI|nr:hypothetical protein CMV_018467 [Castanea mollissima]